MPTIRWTESYDWGTMVVSLKYQRVNCQLLEGTFEASDGGSGVIALRKT